MTAPKLSDSFGAVRVGQQANTAVAYFDPARASGYSQQFNLGVQRELPGSIVIEVTYLANLSRKLAALRWGIGRELSQSPRGLRTVG